MGSQLITKEDGARISSILDAAIAPIIQSTIQHEVARQSPMPLDVMQRIHTETIAVIAGFLVKTGMGLALQSGMPLDDLSRTLQCLVDQAVEEWG